MGCGPGTMPAMSGSSAPSTRTTDSFSFLRVSRRSCFSRCRSFRANSFCRLFERVCTSPPQRRKPSLGKRPGFIHHDAGLSLTDRLDVRRLQPLRPLLGLELDLLTLGQRAEPLRHDGRVVAENIRSTVVLHDEPEALRIIEPLHGTSRHCTSFVCSRTEGRE